MVLVKYNYIISWITSRKCEPKALIFKCIPVMLIEFIVVNTSSRTDSMKTYDYRKYFPVKIYSYNTYSQSDPTIDMWPSAAQCVRV